MVLSESELFELLSYSNNEGAKKRRLIGIQELPTTATAGFGERFVFAFDSGPKTATENPWPE